MSYDPQNAPLDWFVRLGVVTDTEGWDWILARDNDGNEFLVDPADERHLTWGL